jgi:hypothetical protein
MADSPARFVRLLRPPTNNDVGLVALSAHHRTAFYVFKEIPSDIGGRGFVMHRLGLGHVYHVRVGTPAQCSCECLGFYRHGNCKHIQGMLALVGHGLI